MYKTYGKFMKYWKPTGGKCTHVSYPSVWITYRQNGDRRVKLIKGDAEENKQEIEKLILEVSKKKKDLFFLKIILLKRSGVEKKIHESGEYPNRISKY